MASSSRQTIIQVVQVVLVVVIIGLAYFLYLSITEPYAVIRQQQELTDLTRHRMTQVRTAMIRHNEVREGYPHTLDSLVAFVKQDSLLMADPDSAFNVRAGQTFVPDSLPYSPRTGNRFELTVNDTARVPIYLLQDPDSRDHIGAAEPDVTRLNAASWE